MDCAQCGTLKRARESAARHYAITRRNLSSITETDDARYRQAQERAEEARQDFEQAWLAFDNHQREHVLPIRTNAAGR